MNEDIVFWVVIKLPILVFYLGCLNLRVLPNWLVFVRVVKHHQFKYMIASGSGIYLGAIVVPLEAVELIADFLTLPEQIAGLPVVPIIFVIKYFALKVLKVQYKDDVQVEVTWDKSDGLEKVQPSLIDKLFLFRSKILYAEQIAPDCIGFVCESRKRGKILVLKFSYAGNVQYHDIKEKYAGQMLIFFERASQNKG